MLGFSVCTAYIKYSVHIRTQKLGAIPNNVGIFILSFFLSLLLQTASFEKSSNNAQLRAITLISKNGYLATKMKWKSQ